MKNFLVHVTDLRSAYIKVKAKDIVSARKRGLKLVQKALDKCEHWYEANAYEWDDWDKVMDFEEQAFDEKELKQ